jgi:hypothetical protein
VIVSFFLLNIAVQSLSHNTPMDINGMASVEKCGYGMPVLASVGDTIDRYVSIVLQTCLGG